MRNNLAPFLRALCCAGFLFLYSQAAIAVTYTFTGGSTGDWNDPDDWTDNAVAPFSLPGGDEILIEVCVVAPNDLTIHGILTINGCLSIIGNTLTVHGTLNINNNLDIFANGTFVNNGAMTIDAGGVLSGSNSSLTFNGTQTNNGVIDLDASTLTINASKTLTHNGSDLSLDNGSILNINGSLTHAGSSFANVNGDINVGGTLTINASGTLANSSVLTINANGKLISNGTLTNTGTLTNNGTFSGTGTFSGNFTNPNGSTVAPGASPGILTISGDYVNAAGSNLAIELGGTTPGNGPGFHDQLVVTGSATLGGILKVTLFGGHVPLASSTYTILTTATRTGTFSVQWPSGYTGTVIYNAGSVELTAITSLLPVELSDFDARPLEYAVQLIWRTASENGNEGFHVERRANGNMNWGMLAFIAGQGTTTEAQNYVFLDEKPLPGTNYYRLRQVNFDGSAEYSPVIAVEFQSTMSAMRVFPNPVQHGELRLHFAETAGENEEVSLFDERGRVVRRATVFGSTVSFDVSDLAAGWYVAEWRAAGQIWRERVAVIQN